MDIKKLSSKQAAYVLGVGYRTLGAYREAGCPCVKQKNGYVFDAQQLVKWFVEKLHQPEEGVEASSEASSEKTSAKEAALTKKYLAEARLRQIELAERKGLVVQTHLVSQQWRDVGAVLYKNLQAVEKAFGPEAGDAIRQALKDSLEEVVGSAVYTTCQTGALDEPDDDPDTGGDDG